MKICKNSHVRKGGREEWGDWRVERGRDFYEYTYLDESHHIAGQCTSLVRKNIADHPQLLTKVAGPHCTLCVGVWVVHLFVI